MIKVILKPEKGIQIDETKKYLFDPSVIQPYIDASAENATKAEEQANRAEQTFDDMVVFVDNSKQEISVTVEDGKAQVSEAAETAKEDVKQQVADIKVYVDSAKADIDNTVAGGKQEINTTIEEAQTSLSDTIAQAVEDVKAEATKAAEDAIQNAADEATQVATEKTIEYVENTAIPAISAVKDSAVSELESVLATDKSTLEGYVNSAANQASIATQKANEAQASASAAKTSETNAKTSETNAKASASAAKTSETNALNYSNQAKNYAESIDSSTFVKTSGNQTIGGQKTFTSNVFVSSNNPRVLVKDLTLTRGQAGDSGDAKFQIVDKNNMTLGEFRVYNESDGSASACIGANTQDSSGNSIYKTGFRVTAHPNGTSEVSLSGVNAVYAPTPAAADNSTKIATTAWVRSTIKTDAPTPTITYWE